jgi:hypothetical protein
MSHKDFKQELLDLAAEFGLTPRKERGLSQCSFDVKVNGVPMTLWVGHYPGFTAKKEYVWQASLSPKADAVRWGLTDEGIREFLRSSLFLNPIPVARKATDLKALRKG